MSRLDRIDDEWNRNGDNRLDALLTRAVESLEPCPTGLSSRIERRILRARVRRRVAGAGLLIAAGLLAAASYVLSPSPRVASRPATPSVDSNQPEDAVHIVDNGPAGAAQNAPPETRASDVAERPHSVGAAVEIRLSDDLIGEPVPSGNPRVTILWVYPVSGIRSDAGPPESRRPAEPAASPRVAGIQAEHDPAG